MEEEISATGPTDFEEVLTSRICLWKSNSVPKTSRSLHLGTPLWFCFHIHFILSCSPLGYSWEIFLDISQGSIFYESVLVFLVIRVSTEWFIGVQFLSYCLQFLCICSLGDCLQMVKNIFFFLKVILFPYQLTRHWCSSIFIPNFVHGLLSFIRKK